MKEVSKSSPPALQGILRKRAGSGAISVAGYRCSDAFRGLFLSWTVFTRAPPLSSQRCLLVHTTEAGGTCDPRLHYGKVWLRYPCGITVIWMKNHYSRADKCMDIHTSVHSHLKTQRWNQFKVFPCTHKNTSVSHQKQIKCSKTLLRQQICYHR